ncbi:MAG: polyhydroxyalkanoic acid system family protein [Pirellulales bacterium]
MPQFTVTVPHQMPQQEATERVRSLVDRIAQSQAGQVEVIEQTWTDNVLRFGFKTFGIKLTGTMTVGPQDVRVVGDLPFAAMLFKGKIESGIEEQLQKMLGGPKQR